MAENYKHLYEQMKKVVEQYQDEIVPGLRKMAEELGQRQAASSWIRVEDRMPHAAYGESDNVLTVDGNGLVEILNFDGGCWCYPTGEPVLYKDPLWRITHWMPLPEPPKEE